MADEDDTSIRMGLRDYVRFRLVQEETEDIESARELMNAAVMEYIVHGDVDSIETEDYHYLSVVRIDDLLDGALGKYREELEANYDILVHDGEMNETAAAEIADRFGRYIVGNSITLAYSIAYEVVEDLLRELLPRLLNDHYQEEAGPALVSQLESFDSKLQVLQASGIIDDDTAAGVRHIKSIRDHLVHEVDKRLTLSMMDSLTDVNRALSAVTDLYEEVYGYPAYQYTGE